MSVQKLCTLSVGQWGVVEQIEPDCPLRERLLLLGFAPGERVCRMYTDKKGFLSAYRVENSLIAVRKTDAASVLVRV